MANAFPKTFFVGLNGISIQFSNKFSDVANQAALHFSQKIKELQLPWITQISTSLTSVYIGFEPIAISDQDALSSIKQTLENTNWFEAPIATKSRLFEIPCVFGTNLAPQFDSILSQTGFNRDQAIANLTAQRIRVLALGFAPGQPYLGQLGSEWDIARLPQITPNVPKGGVVCAIRQLIIFSNDSPTGWHHIGQTAFECFNTSRKDPVILKPGDEIILVSIQPDELTSIQNNNHDGLGGAKITIGQSE